MWCCTAQKYKCKLVCRGLWNFIVVQEKLNRYLHTNFKLESIFWKISCNSTWLNSILSLVSLIKSIPVQFASSCPNWIKTLIFCLLKLWMPPLPFNKFKLHSFFALKFRSLFKTFPTSLSQKKEILKLQSCEIQKWQP